MPQENDKDANHVDPSENPGDEMVDPSEDEGAAQAVSSLRQDEQSIGEPSGEGDGPNR